MHDAVTELQGEQDGKRSAGVVVATIGGAIPVTIGATALVLLVIGCGPGLSFPDRVLERRLDAGLAVLAFDVDRDGNADYWQRTDADGRKVSIQYAENGGPGEIISLDAVGVDDCPHLIVILDGVPFDVIHRMYNQGAFRLFHAPVPLISCYPSMTDLALAEAFEVGPCLGFEALYFDRNAQKLSDGNGVYMSGANAPWTRLVDYRCSTFWDTRVYLSPRSVFEHEMRQIAATFREIDGGEAICYSVGTAGLGTRGGESAIVDYLKTVDRLCEEIVHRRRGRVKISLFADHGHNLTRCRRVSFRKPIEKAGYRWAKSMTQRGREVVPVEYGLVTYAAFATVDPKGVADVVLRHEAVDLVFYRGSDDTVIVRGPETEAHVAMGPTGLRYQPTCGDPVKLGAILDGLKLAGHVAEDGGIDAEAMFAATVRHTYPDPLARVWRAFHGLVDNPADLIVNLRDGYCHGSKFFHVMTGDPASTHGSLNRVNSTAFAMTMRGRLPGALRIKQVLRALRQAGKHSAGSETDPSGPP